MRDPGNEVDGLVSIKLFESSVLQSDLVMSEEEYYLWCPELNKINNSIAGASYM